MSKTLASIKADKRRVLLVTADPLLQARFRALLADMRHGVYEVDEIEDCRGARPRMTGGYDACIASLAGRSAANASEMLGELAEAVDSPVIVVADCRESGLAAIHAGADDYLESSTLTPELVDRSIRYVLQKREMARQSARLACEQSARAVIQKRNFRLHLLCEAASELLSVEDPVELLGRLYPKLAAHLGLDCFAHHLVDEHTDTLALQASSGIPVEAMDRVQRLDFSAVLSRQSAAGDEQDTSLLADSLASLLNVRAYFCYPLMVHGYILGTLSFGSRRRARFSSSELVFLKTVCHYLATALDRKRLTRELTDRANRLSESEHRFRVMAETVPDFLLSGRADGECDFCNQQFCKYTGLTLGEVAGSGWLAAMHPDDAEKVGRSWRRICTSGELLELEHRFRTAGGDYRWFVGRWRGVCGADGQVVRWIGSCADIDDLKKVDATLRENQARLHQAAMEAEHRAREAEEGRRVLDAIMEHAPIGIAVADGPDAIRLVSRQGRDMLARPAVGEPDGTNPLTALEELISSNRPESPLVRALRHGETVNNCEVVVHPGSGLPVPLLCSAGPIRDGEGRITGAVATWVDISDRKRAERVLKQSERQFRAIFETSPDCIVIVDDEMRIAKGNPAANAAFGVESEGLIGRSMTEFVRPESRIEEMRRALLQTGRYSGEMQVARPAGGMADYDVGAAFSFMPGRHLVVFHDTTERRLIERRLLESESRFRTLAQALPQIIWTADAGGKIDFVNQKMTEVAGLTFEDACREGWAHLIHPEDVDRSVTTWEQAVRTGVNYTVEHRLRHTDDSFRWFLTRGVPVRDASGQIVKWFGSTTDIHDQKLAEQNLSREHAAVENERRRLRAVLDVLPVAVFIADNAGRITDVNPAVAQTWGRLPVLSSSLEDFAEYYRGFSTKTGRQVPVQERGLYRAVMHGESVAGEEMEFMRSDGKRGSILNHAEPIRDATGRIMGGVAVSVDITDLKRTQRQLLELNDALEQRVRDRTRSLLTYQEHLRAMTSELVLTEQRERRRLATELHDYLAQLLVASKMKSKLVSHHVEASGNEVMQDLRDLIDEALKYTRTLIADLSPTILYEAGLFTAIHWLGEQMQRHNLAVRIEEEIEPLDVPDDKAVMIFQTIRELLFNVVKHARVHEATVRLEQSAAGELVVTVEDAGAGFDPSRQEFHPAGGKFGLFSVRERLVALGGVFELRSTPGEGTRALIRVPVEPRPISEDAAGPIAATALPASAEMRRRDTIRVLLADDHKMVREGFRTLIECDPQLEVAGEAANGEEALEFARLLQPDVVIMDINMPRMNGIEATRRLKLELPHIAVIGLSVHDDRGLIASMLEAGASMYLTKGGQSEELSRAIHSTYEQQVNRLNAQSEL